MDKDSSFFYKIIKTTLFTVLFFLLLNIKFRFSFSSRSPLSFKITVQPYTATAMNLNSKTGSIISSAKNETARLSAPKSFLRHGQGISLQGVTKFYSVPPSKDWNLTVDDISKLDLEVSSSPIINQSNNSNVIFQNEAENENEIIAYNQQYSQSIKKLKNLCSSTSLSLKNKDVSCAKDEKQAISLVLPDIKKALNSAIDLNLQKNLEIHNSKSRKGFKSFTKFSECHLKAQVFGEPITPFTSLGVENEPVHVTFKITPRGSSLRYALIKSVLDRIDFAQPITLDYSFNPLNGQKIVTKVKHFFSIVPYEVDHLHNSAAKQSMGQINRFNQRESTDFCEARVVGKFFHKIRSNFRMHSRDINIRYYTKEALIVCLENYQKAFENFITQSFYQKDCDLLANKITLEDRDNFQSKFLESETLEETTNGYRQLHRLKVYALRSKDQVFRDLGLLVTNYIFTSDNIIEKVTNAAIGSKTNMRFIFNNRITHGTPDNLAYYVRESALKGLSLCFQRLSFMKDVCLVFDKTSITGLDVHDRFQITFDTLKSQGGIILKNLTDFNPSERDKILTKMLNPDSFFKEGNHYLREKKLEILEKVARTLESQGLETYQYLRLFPEQIPWDEINIIYAKCESENRMPEEADFAWLAPRIKKIEQDCDNIDNKIIKQFSVLEKLSSDEKNKALG